MVASRPMREFVCFAVHGLELAAPIDHVRETIAVRPITRVFRTPPSVAGIISLRGEIIAVLDLGALLGMQASARSDETRIVIVRHDGRDAGLLVDRLAQIREIAEEDIASPPPTLSPRVAAVLEGIVSLPDHPVCILDVRRIFDAPELAPHTKRVPPQVAAHAAPETST